jgi:anti-anti-sigma regulatory factor
MQMQGDWRRHAFSFSIETPVEASTTVRFRLGGSITEEAVSSFETIIQEIAKVGRTEVVLNLADVAFMNSIGIQRWMGFLKKIEPPLKLVLEECSPEVVSHINLVLGFARRAEVRSIHSPYSCPKCRKQKIVLHNTKDVSVDDYPKPPACECGESMLLDEPEDEYFAFLERS